MAKKEFQYEIIEIIDVLEESPKGNWAKVLMKVSWNDQVPVLDIRNIDMSTIDDEQVKFGKGISLSDKGVERLAKNLLELGYIDEDEVEEYFENEDSIFKKDKKHKINIKRK